MTEGRFDFTNAVNSAIGEHRSVRLDLGEYPKVDDDFPSTEDTKEIDEGNVATELDPRAVHIILDRHIVDIDPKTEGNREELKTIQSGVVGAAEVAIDRTEPTMWVESLSLVPGTSKVLVGRNGAGKSTLLDAIMDRDHAHLHTREGSGAVHFGEPVHVRDKLRIARLNQEEILSGIGEMLAGAVLIEAATYFKSQLPVDGDWSISEEFEKNIKNQEAHQRIDTLADQVTKIFDMQEFMDTRVEDLSGGEKTKLALFMLILSEPDVLLLDEPTNHLDLRSISLLTSLFRQYQAQGVAILSASHVTWFLDEASTDGIVEVLWNKSGRTVRQSRAASVEDVLRDPSRQETPIINAPIRWLQPNYDYKQGRALIDTSGDFSIPDSPLHDIKLENIGGGTLIVVSGNNGTGKTKLIDTIASNRRPEMPRISSEVNVAYLPQFWPEHIAAGTVGDFFEWVRYSVNPAIKSSSQDPMMTPLNLFKRLIKDLAFGGAKSVGDGWLRKPLAQYSGGEQRLLWFLAVTTLPNIDMLILDEPTNHMDVKCQEYLTAAIQDYPGAVVLASHDKILMRRLFNDPVFRQSKQPRHWLLTKREGASTITASDESPVAYYDGVMAQARRDADRIRL